MNLSSRTGSCFVVLLASLMAACEPSLSPSETPSEVARPNGPTHAFPAQRTDPMTAPALAPIATARPASKPKSAATIGGASISDVAGAAVVGEMKKAGWVDLAVALTRDSIGAYESVRFDLKKGKATGHCEIVRPLENPPSELGAGMTPPRDQKADRDREGATYFDEASDVLVIVVVDGNPKQAKKLIDGLVKAPTAQRAPGPKGPRMSQSIEIPSRPK